MDCQVWSLRHTFHSHSVLPPSLAMASSLLPSLLPHYCTNAYEPVPVLNRSCASPQKPCPSLAIPESLLSCSSFTNGISYSTLLLLYSSLTLNNSCLFPSPKVCPMEWKSHESKDSIIFFGSFSFFSRVPSRWYCLKP